jgi:hypothetical protein
MTETLILVIPACCCLPKSGKHFGQAGILSYQYVIWIPAFAGMTTLAASRAFSAAC